MNVGIFGTGAIAHKHAQAYQKIGFPVVACGNRSEESGRKFAAQYGAAFVPSFEELCRRTDVDVIDVCTFPDFRLEAVKACVATGKNLQVEKPIATRVSTAREMIRIAREGGIVLNVISQRRFDDTTLFLAKAVSAGRLGRILQCDCYVKWHRSAEYYGRPGKGSWAVEGGGALINQAIHQVDLVRWLAGPVQEVTANWQLGAVHAIESEDIVNAILRFESGATGVVQASTAFWPGYTERIEIHGTKGSAIVAGGKLIAWDVVDDHGDPAPVGGEAGSGASDPMAISTVPLERQFRNFAEAVESGEPPLVSGEQALAALEVVEAIYDSCRTGQKVLMRNRA